MRNPSSITALLDERKRATETTRDRMEQVRAVYDGEHKVELPEVDGMAAPPVPNILAQGVDQMAGRIASVQPSVRVVPTQPGRRAERRAKTAASVLGAWMSADRLPLKQVQRARHLTAYGCTATVMSWNRKEHRPTWEIRQPSGAYWPLGTPLDQAIPDDIVFEYRRTAGWLRANGYGAQVQAVSETYNDIPDTQMLTVLEYLDPDQHTLLLTNGDGYGRRRRTAILTTREHHLGVTPATISQRVGLDRLGGQFDQMLAMYEAQAQLMALEILAVQKGIFPDTFLESRPGEIARFIDGPHDGRTGKVNIVAGGQIRALTEQPGYLTNPTIDRLERNQRVTSGIPSEFGGEAGGNIRTGRRGDAVLSAATDMPIAYAQGILAAALESEAMIAGRMAARYDGQNTRSVTSGAGTAPKAITYRAADLFDDDTRPSVIYPAAGSDINQLVVGLGQRVGLGIMSKKTASQLDPMIDNPEYEHDSIIAEGLEQSLLAGIQQQASSGQIPPLVLAKVIRLVQSDRLELADALTKVTEDAIKEQERKQAEEQPAMTPEMAMAGPAAQAMTGNPEAMSPVPGAGPGPQDFTSLLASLRLPLAGMENRVGTNQQTGRVAV
jgi:hypothetical protein